MFEQPQTQTNITYIKIVTFLLAVFCLSAASDVKIANAAIQGLTVDYQNGVITNFDEPSNFNYLQLRNVQPFTQGIGEYTQGTVYYADNVGGWINHAAPTPSDPFELCGEAGIIGVDRCNDVSPWDTGIYYIVLFTDYCGNPGGEWDCYNVSYQRVFYDADTETFEYRSDVPDQLDINIVKQTRFLDLDITGTSTLSINAPYYIDANELDVTNQQSNPTGVQYRYGTSSTFETEIDTITPQSGHATSSIELIGLSDGTYDLNITFYNFAVSFSGAQPPFPYAYLYGSFTITGGVLTEVSEFENYNGLNVPQQSIYQECSITNISGCISNSFVYLFVPQAYSTEEIFTIKDELQQKTPFVYFYQVPDLWNTLYTTTQDHSLTIGVTTTIGYVQFISEAQLNAIPLTATVRQIIGYLLWIMLALLLYAETKRIFNHQPTT